MCKLKTIANSCIITSILLGSNCLANPRSSASHLNNDIYLLKMGMAGISGTQSRFEPAPAIGLAKRFEINEAAIEVSINYAGLNDNGQFSKHYSLPKVTYLMFHDPNSTNSFYYGAGLSWGAVKQTNRANLTHDGCFKGMFLEGTAGYELHRDQKIRTTLELNISQPLVASSHDGINHWPSVFANIGFGFF